MNGFQIAKPLMSRTGTGAGRVLLLFALLMIHSAFTLAADHPPVLFIAVDDLNDWVGVLGGHAQTSTPNLDRLAARGMLFRAAHCAAPLCNPSRTALLTGVRPHESGVYSNWQPWRPALPDAVTLPQYFAQHGYHVAGGGKIFHDSFNERASFSEYFVAPGNARPLADKIQSPINRKGKQNLSWGPVEGNDDVMSDAHLVDWAIERLGEPREKPLFLAVGFRKPHLSWFVPKKYFDLHPLDQVTLPVLKENDLSDVPAKGIAIAHSNDDHESILKSGLYKNAVQAYLAAISFHDAQLGRLLDALDAHPRGKDTIIVYWSDHGWHLGEKEHWRKFTLWERATRVPLIISAPGVTQPGTTSDQTVDLMTIYPTMIELAGLPARSDLQSPSLVPLLRNPSAPWPHYALTTFERGNHAVRKDHWRYIRYADGGEELYDHRRDPNEWTNLANDVNHASIKAELLALLPTENAENASPGSKKRKDSEKNRDSQEE